MRSLAEQRRNFCVVKMDLKNAFNAVSRAAVIESYLFLLIIVPSRLGLLLNFS